MLPYALNEGRLLLLADTFSPIQSCLDFKYLLINQLSAFWVISWQLLFRSRSCIAFMRKLASTFFSLVIINFSVIILLLNLAVFIILDFNKDRFVPFCILLEFFLHCRKVFTFVFLRRCQFFFDTFLLFDSFNLKLLLQLLQFGLFLLFLLFFANEQGSLGLIKIYIPCRRS